MQKASLPNLFFVLAPMDDVTDTVFRQIINDCAPADLYFTEFVNVDGLTSPGRDRLMPKLKLHKSEKNVIAQVWGKEPKNFQKIAGEVVKMGFVGIDINFGCPEKNIVRNNTCSAFILPENRGRAIEIIKAVQKGVDGKIPVSVKTRLGFNEVDFTWHELLLAQKLNMLTIHGRTRKQMSKVPADWEMIAKIRELRDQLSPTTLIVGNGDVRDRPHAEQLSRKYSIDGVMIGRGIFDDPFAFAAKSPWPNYSRQQRIKLFKKHVELFAKTWAKGERCFDTLKKFAKVYINGFDGASELRAKVMNCKTTNELIDLLSR